MRISLASLGALGDSCGAQPSDAQYLASGKTHAQWSADYYAWVNCVNAAQSAALACPAGQHFEGSTVTGHCVGNPVVPVETVEDPRVAYGNAVMAVYQTYLHRAATSGELTQWVNALVGGQPWSQVQTAIIALAQPVSHTCPAGYKWVDDGLSGCVLVPVGSGSGSGSGSGAGAGGGSGSGGSGTSDAGDTFAVPQWALFAGAAVAVLLAVRR